MVLFRKVRKVDGKPSYSLGYCEHHKKVLYVSRKQARRHRWHGCDLNAYRCDVLEGWHLGHLPPFVKDGTTRRWR